MKSASESLNEISNLVLPALQEVVPPSREFVKDKLERLLKIVLSSFTRDPRGWQGRVFLLDATKQIARIAACVGEKRWAEECEFKLASGDLISCIASQQDAHVINDVSQDPRTKTIQDFAALEKRKFESFLGAPIILQGETVGVMTFWSPIANVFVPTDADLVGQAAAFAALLLHLEQHAAIKQEHDLYLKELYAKKKQEMQQNPCDLSQEEIDNLFQSGETLRQVIDGLSSVEVTNHARPA